MFATFYIYCANGGVKGRMIDLTDLPPSKVMSSNGVISIFY